MWSLWLEICSKRWLESACCFLFMKEISHSNVKFVTTDVLERVPWKIMFHQFMKGKSHLNVKFATTVFLEKVFWINMFHLFMKEISNWNVTSLWIPLLSKATYEEACCINSLCIQVLYSMQLKMAQIKSILDFDYNFCNSPTYLSSTIGFKLKVG